MNSIEKATKRNTSKGRQAKTLIARATPEQIAIAEIAFSRSAPTWADFEFVGPIIYGANEQ